MKQKQYTTQSGFAMLFTVLLMSLILSIALGISNVTFKQTILSSLARDSGIAFYQADAGMECMLYYDFNVSTQQFPVGSLVTDVPTELSCGDSVLRLDTAASDTDKFMYVSPQSSNPCIASILIDKRDSFVVIQSRGNNICEPHPRQVERALEVRY